MLEGRLFATDRDLCLCRSRAEVTASRLHFSFVQSQTSHVSLPACAGISGMWGLASRVSWCTSLGEDDTVRFWSSALQLLREVAVQCASRSGTCAASVEVSDLQLRRSSSHSLAPLWLSFGCHELTASLLCRSSHTHCSHRKSRARVGPFSPQARHGHQRWPRGCPCRFCRARGACARGFKVANSSPAEHELFLAGSDGGMGTWCQAREAGRLVP